MSSVDGGVMRPVCVFSGVGAQKVRVDDELEAYPTESVDLRCEFIDGGGRTKLTQVGGSNATLFIRGFTQLHVRCLSHNVKHERCSQP